MSGALASSFSSSRQHSLPVLVAEENNSNPATLTSWALTCEQDAMRQRRAAARFRRFVAAPEAPVSVGEALSKLRKGGRGLGGLGRWFPVGDGGTVRSDMPSHQVAPLPPAETGLFARGEQGLGDGSSGGRGVGRGRGETGRVPILEGDRFHASLPAHGEQRSGARSDDWGSGRRGGSTAPPHAMWGAPLMPSRLQPVMGAQRRPPDGQELFDSTEFGSRLPRAQVRQGSGMVGDSNSAAAGANDRPASRDDVPVSLYDFSSGHWSNLRKASDLLLN